MLPLKIPCVYQFRHPGWAATKEAIAVGVWVVTRTVALEEQESLSTRYEPEHLAVIPTRYEPEGAGS